MNTVFAERDDAHASHLRDVTRALVARGFSVEQTGFELLSETEQRSILKQQPIGMLRRWWPDLLATRGPYGGFWVDAKSDLSTTENYSIELAAVACYGLLEVHLRRTVVVVWPGGRCNYTRDLTPVHVETRGGTRGSDTAFVLVKKADQRPFDDIFGAVATQEMAA